MFRRAHAWLWKLSKLWCRGSWSGAPARTQMLISWYWLWSRIRRLAHVASFHPPRHEHANVGVSALERLGHPFREIDPGAKCDVQRATGSPAIFQGPGRWEKRC